MSSKQSACIIRRFLFLSLLALLAGCGGGGSSGGDVPGFANRMITAFSFTAAANPQLGSDITGTINEESGTILLSGPLDADDVAGLKASFTTTGKEVSVGGVVQESGVTGNSFTGPLTYRVTAADGSTRDYTVSVAYWKHPSGLSDNISPDGLDEYGCQVAMDNSGNALIVWYQDDGSRDQIFKSEYRDGEWIHPEGPDNNISSDEDADAYYPQVAMDASGNAVIVWVQSDGIRQQIYKSEYRDGEWTHLANPGDHISLSEQNANEPQVAMNHNGNAIIVWEQGPIFKSEYRDGEWIHPADLDDNISPDGEDADAYYPQVAMDDNGNALIVWEQFNGSNYQVFKSEYRDGEWTHPADLDDHISPDGQDAEEPHAAMDNNGNAVIVWDQDDGSNWRIFKSEYRNGAWTHPADLDEYISPDGYDAYPSRVAMDNSGNALIVWEQYDGSNWQVFKSEYRFWEE
ncbi:MAG: hypothetical protein GXY28_04400 [Bacteriovoracaceae bacterium]|jgi:mRNA-degrading endonuclease HigB of HigAB toxin-antitoxin module|nr:hypothetical protein [Pseudomonadota bacterium]NLW67020.1 hypothetical protein [Bacteriovoracaceae bacterium]HPV29780.1 hypothetical protein [Deltaproteobacteria bacterium]HPX50864.1 hypothetical protein [Deltaproteobacteria bacterium]